MSEKCKSDLQNKKLPLAIMMSRRVTTMAIPV